MTELQAVVQEYAVEAYTGGATPAQGPDWLASDDLLEIQRRSQLLGLATAPQNLSLDQYDALREDLDLDQTRLEQATKEAEQLLTELERDSELLQAQMLDAQQAQIELEQQLAREEDTRRRAEAERQLVADAQRRAEQQRRSATTTSRPPTTTTTSPPPTTTPDDGASTAEPASDAVPSGAAIVCPIRGTVSFVDSWGAPRSGGRSHQGVDLMSPAGTPNVAVVSGEVRQKDGDLSGLGVYLYGDDGNSYWYFHLSGYEGPPRRVQQGEVVGYVGSSGNADVSAPHTHFEYHPGGGRAVNPYPLTRSAC